jgi:hypothetical protein
MSKFANTARVGMAMAGAALTLVAAGGVSSAAPATVTCARGYFCAYPGINFTGEPIRMYTCIDYGIPWYGHGSWINNQTGGARAEFKDDQRITRWVSDVPYTDDRDADWSWVHRVRPC